MENIALQSSQIFSLLCYVRKTETVRKKQKKPSESVFAMRLNLQLKTCMMLLAKDFSLRNNCIKLLINYKQPDYDLRININTKYQSIIRYDLQVYRQLTLTHKCLVSSQPRTQACQLSQASAVLVPVLTCPSFDPLSRSSSFKFGFLVFY